MYLKFLFLFSKFKNDFSFSSRNWGKGIQISLSPLEIGEIIFKLLFLLDLTLLPLVNQVPVGYQRQHRAELCCIHYEISQIGNKFQCRKGKGTFPLSHTQLPHCHTAIAYFLNCRATHTIVSYPTRLSPFLYLSFCDDHISYHIICSDFYLHLPLYADFAHS